MFTRTLLLLLLHAGATLSMGSSAFAQDASRDRADLDAAAGRTVFHNVLLADPQAFASRPRITPDRPRRSSDLPAATGEASADRQHLDAAAGRPVFHSALQCRPRRLANKPPEPSSAACE
jgi:hypothetical protein